VRNLLSLSSWFRRLRNRHRPGAADRSGRPRGRGGIVVRHQTERAECRRCGSLFGAACGWHARSPELLPELLVISHRILPIVQTICRSEQVLRSSRHIVSVC